MAGQRSSWLTDAVRGALAGAIATWVMDLVTTGLYEGQPAEVTDREAAARPNGKSAVENLLDQIEAMTGLEVEPEGRPQVLQAIHYSLGILPGAAYGVLRHRVPLVGAARGLLYGLVLFGVNDEYLSARLGLAGPMEAYPVETHWRGAVGHAALGVTTDTAIDLLGG